MYISGLKESVNIQREKYISVIAFRTHFNAFDRRDTKDKIFLRTVSKNAIAVEIKGRVSGTPCVHGTQIGILCEGIVGRGWNRLIWNSAPYSRRSSHERAWRLLSRGRENTRDVETAEEKRGTSEWERRKGEGGEWMHIITFFPGAKPIATSVAPKWRYDFPAVENVFTRPRNNNVEKKVSRPQNLSTWYASPVREALLWRGGEEIWDRVDFQSCWTPSKETRYNLIRFYNSSKNSREYLLTVYSAPV